MAIVQEIVNGKVPETPASTTASGKSSDGDSTKDMFLKLLVTEMKYQDPLEPTDNSEYVKEMATFTQVETLQAVQGNVDGLEAKSLVGKYVTVANDAGEDSGIIDYVTEQDGVTKISINDTLYDMDSITSVQNETYYMATLAAETFTNMVDQMPALGALTYQDYDKITAAESLLNGMNSYQQSFITDDTMNKYNTIVERLNELIKAKAAIDAAEAEKLANEADSAGADASDAAASEEDTTAAATE